MSELIGTTEVCTILRVSPPTAKKLMGDYDAAGKPSGGGRCAHLYLKSRVLEVMDARKKGTHTVVVKKRRDHVKVCLVCGVRTYNKQDLCPECAETVDPDDIYGVMTKPKTQTRTCPVRIKGVKCGGELKEGEYMCRKCRKNRPVPIAHVDMEDMYGAVNL